MSASKNIEKICAVVTVLTILLAIVFCNGQAFGIQISASAMDYENRLFDSTKVHRLDIVMNDWDSFIENCESEEYSNCNVAIDGELIKNVGIRAKGNTSLSSVRSMDSQRYSLKIEFDHYDSTKNYHGLDKLCLNNIIQDNTYMKDYLAYTLMYDFDVDAPLCSYAFITVNGEDWGLYLAVEAIEEAFLQRNYGRNYGDLYKPDSMSFGGGGPGNGRNFDMSDFMNGEQNADSDNAENNMPDFPNGQPPQLGGARMHGFGNGEMPQFDGGMPSDFDPSEMFGGKNGKDGGGFDRGSDDVKLNYTDDNFDSYSNIFNNAKTAVTTADKTRLIQSLKQLSHYENLEEIINTDEVLRYFVVHNFLCNGDSYTGQMIHNYYIYEKNGQLSMIPWDYNLAFGTFQGGNAQSSVNAAIDTPVSNGMDDRPMVAWIFSDAKYTEEYHKLFAEFLNRADMQSLIHNTAELIDEYVQKDPTKFCTYEEFQKGVTAISKFCELRAESVQGQLNGTIPGTSDGQKENSDALIDASSLNISDMGTMNMGGGKGFGNRNFDRRTSENSNTTATAKTMSNLRPVGNNEMPYFNGEMPEDFGGKIPPNGFDGQIPEGFDGQMPPDDFGGDMPDGFDPSQIQNGKKPSSDSNGVNEDVNPENRKETESDASRPSMEQFPSMHLNHSNSSVNIVTWILLGVSVFFLVFGLIIAFKFKR